MSAETPRSEILFYKTKSEWDAMNVVAHRRKLKGMEKEQVFAECGFIQLPPDIRNILIAEVDHATAS